MTICKDNKTKQEPQCKSHFKFKITIGILIFICAFLFCTMCSLGVWFYFLINTICKNHITETQVRNVLKNLETNLKKEQQTYNDLKKNPQDTNQYKEEIKKCKENIQNYENDISVYNQLINTIQPPFKQN